MATPLLDELSAEQRAGLQKRTMLVLAVALILASAATTGGVTVAILIAEDMLGSSTLAGSTTAAATAGAAFMAVVLARIMNDSGRRPGLRAGYLVALAGAGVSLLSLALDSFPVFLLGLFLFGGARASNLQARFAAADLVPDDQRSRAISLLVWTGTIGSVTGPLLVGLSKRFSLWLGFDELAGPYMFALVFLMGSSAVISLLLRPDPLVVAGGLGTGSKKERNVRHALRVVSKSRHASFALGTMMTSQLVMSAVMVMTPSHMSGHGHDVEVIGFVFSAHIFGMYGLAPVTGWISDKIGRLRAAGVGGAILVVATVLAAASGDNLTLLFPALFLLGFGWNFGLISSSALLTESVALKDRVTVQGSADMLMSLCGGMAGLLSGVIKGWAGYSTLGNIGTVLSLCVIVGAVSVMRLGSRTATGVGV